MSDKPPKRIVLLDVDLKCDRCNKKIRKVLDKYHDKWDIESYVLDDKNNEVKINGHFDPDKLVKRLCNKACEVIREWCIQPVQKPAPPPKPEPPKADPPKKDPPKADPPKKDPPPKADPPKADPPKKDPPKADPPKADPPPKKDPPKADPPPKKDPAPPVAPPALPQNCYPLPYPYPYPIPYYYPGGGCDGHNKPCSCGGSCGGYRPCGCGCGGGCSGAYQQQQQPQYPDYGRPCQWVCEEETTNPCTIM